ncbi:MAG: type II toxin-antitoxin system RelE/ParE family toxin [Dysgonamonadaceae bacterium]|jgi:mRNA interferase RelE/StbE|nr:type II toxin-antitoxin system RelE/ParE family toxin [Dysgonamonadaceae bacterium]
MYKVSISRPAQKNVRNIPKDYYQTIVKRIFELAENPRPFGSKKLSGFDNLYRIRVGVYRIIYAIEDNILTVEIIKVDHRSSVYRV